MTFSKGMKVVGLVVTLAVAGSGCSGAGRPLGANDRPEAVGALRAIHPAAGFDVHPCVTQPAMCFASAELISPFTAAGVRQLISSFGVAPVGKIDCQTVGGVGKQIMLCNTAGRTGRYDLTITIDSHSAASTDARPKASTTISFTAVRVR